LGKTRDILAGISRARGTAVGFFFKPPRTQGWLPTLRGLRRVGPDHDASPYCRRWTARCFVMACVQQRSDPLGSPQDSVHHPWFPE